MVRIVLGFIAAALWLPVLELVAGEISGGYGRFWFGMTAMFTVPLTVLVAVPLFYVWRRRITFWRCVFAGLVIGIIGAGLFLLTTNPLAALNWSPLLIVVGVLSSLVFWAIAVWRNPTLTVRRSEEASNAAI
jgi:hypothetical protein